jgi:hypothetical protein
VCFFGYFLCTSKEALHQQTNVWSSDSRDSAKRFCFSTTKNGRPQRPQSPEPIFRDRSGSGRGDTIKEQLLKSS